MARKKGKPPKIGGKYCRSQFEYDVYKALKNVMPKRAVIEYEEDKLEYTVTKNYIPDFTITKKDGTIIYIEAKGLGRAFDYQNRVKMEAVKEQHPDKDIRIVFYSDRPLRKGGKMRPSDWAKQNGFIFSIGEIPEEWFKEDNNKNNEHG